MCSLTPGRAAFFLCHSLFLSRYHYRFLIFFSFFSVLYELVHESPQKETIINKNLFFCDYIRHLLERALRSSSIFVCVCWTPHFGANTNNWPYSLMHSICRSLSKYQQLFTWIARIALSESVRALSRIKFFVCVQQKPQQEKCIYLVRNDKEQRYTLAHTHTHKITHKKRKCSFLWTRFRIATRHPKKQQKKKEKMKRDTE